MIHNLWIIVILFKKYYKDKLTEDGEVSGDAAVAALTDIDTKINAYRLIEVSLAQKVKFRTSMGRPWRSGNPCQGSAETFPTDLPVRKIIIENPMEFR